MWFVAAVIVILDQSLKTILGRQGFRLVFNQGVAFGLLPGRAWTFLVGAVILWLVLVGLRGSIWWWLIIGGGVSNFLDRLRYKAVVDYVFLAHLPAFNLADIAIVVAVLVLGLLELSKR